MVNREAGHFKANVLIIFLPVVKRAGAPDTVLGVAVSGGLYETSLELHNMQ